MKQKILVAVVGLGLLLIFGTTLAVAQDGNPTPTDNQVNQIAQKLYCPVCENIPLDVCPTQACAQWREVIRTKLAEGWSETKIMGYFAEQYGDRVLAQPPAKGLNWVLYIIPPIAVIAGGYLLLKTMRSWKKPPAAHAQTTEDTPKTREPGEDPYLLKIKEELQRRE